MKSKIYAKQVWKKNFKILGHLLWVYITQMLIVQMTGNPTFLYVTMCNCVQWRRGQKTVIYITLLTKKIQNTELW